MELWNFVCIEMFRNKDINTNIMFNFLKYVNVSRPPARVRTRVTQNELPCQGVEEEI